MEEIVKEESLLNKKTILNSLKIFAVTLGIIIFVFFFVISSIFVISPKNDAKLFNFLGFERAEEACYIRQYEKTGSKADLYNLILLESELENYEKELMYINELVSDKDYVEFYTKLDKSAINAVEDKSLIAYTCNTNGYLINQKLKCMYKLGFDDGVSATVRNYIKAQINGDYLFENSFVTYIEFLNSDDSLTKEDKINKINLVYDDVALTQRLSDLIDFINSDITLEQEIVAQNSVVGILKAIYLIDVINEAPEVAVSKGEYQTALADYNDLINS